MFSGKKSAFLGNLWHQNLNNLTTMEFILSFLHAMQKIPCHSMHAELLKVGLFLQQANIHEYLRLKKLVSLKMMSA